MALKNKGIAVDDGVWAALDKIAKKRGISRNALVGELLRRGVKAETLHEAGKSYERFFAKYGSGGAWEW